MTLERRPIRALLAVALCASAACSVFGPKPDPSQFFVLTPVAPLAATQPDAARVPSVGLGPIHLPDYLRRPSLVVRTGEAQIQPSAVDRWGEPVDKAVPRVLQEDLRRDLGTDRVVLFPWYGNEAPALQVQIDVLRLDRDPDNRAILVARWEIREPSGKAVLVAREARIAREPAGPQTAAGVEALSAALGDLSHEIAAAVIALPRGGR